MDEDDDAGDDGNVERPAVREAVDGTEAAGERAGGEQCNFEDGGLTPTDSHTNHSLPL